MKYWVTIAVDTSVGWPDEETAVEFEGHTIRLRPATDEIAPCIDLAYDDPPLSYEDGYQVLTRFMTSLAWVKGHHIRETMSGGGGFRESFGHGIHARHVSPRFRTDYLPAPTDPKARLALALYREALNVNSTAYQFLGFFKILNVIHRNGPGQITWINANLGDLAAYDAVRRLKELQPIQADVGQYLYESGRCAVAHAYSDPIVDPDNLEDHRRLRADLPVIRALAEQAIEKELDVRSAITVRREHLYELQGFRSLCSDPFSESMVTGDRPELASYPTLPPLSIRIRDEEQLDTFAGLTAMVEDAEAGKAVVDCHSSPPHACLKLALNFKDEVLEFDPVNQVAVVDDGSPAAAQAAIDVHKLIAAWLGNGELEISNADTGEVLSRRDPYIPTDIDLTRSLQSIQRIILDLEGILQARRSQNE